MCDDDIVAAAKVVEADQSSLLCPQLLHAMNNSQFRRLVLDTPAARPPTGDGPAATPRGGPAVLGSKLRANIPMTPRSLTSATSSGSVDFARQLAERDAANGSSRPAKRFRASAAPKGAKLPAGYRDRTRDREGCGDDEADDKAARVQALEEMVRLQQMDAATFVRLRDEIVGGDLGTTHLIKGLDWRLLERVRRGEDVTKDDDKDEKVDLAAGKEPQQEDVDVDQAFDELEEKEVRPVQKEKTARKGEMAPPPPKNGADAIAGKKRSRDEILAELRASRRAAAQPSLGPKFRKMGERRETSRIERDERGREVLITVDEDGHVKRKVKKAKVDVDAVPGKGLLMPDKDVAPLGTDLPEAVQSAIASGLDAENDDDGDIFEDAGADYDPLAGLDEDDDHSSSSGEDRGPHPERAAARPTKASPPMDTSTSNVPLVPLARRNYFADTNPTSSPPSSSSPTSTPLKDPTILAALRKASTLPAATATDDASSPADAARAARRREMLSSHDRDAEDMDLGFGSSRFDDAEEGEGGGLGKGKLAIWKGAKDEGDGQGEQKTQRKRGKKKRKGDGESAADVLGVLERRREREKKA